MRINQIYQLCRIKIIEEGGVLEEEQKKFAV